MDNFKRYRSRTPRQNSIDGFVVASSKKTKKNTNSKEKDAFKDNHTRIGNFNSVDGFHPVDKGRRKIGEVKEYKDSGLYSPHQMKRQEINKIDFSAPPRPRRRFGRAPEEKLAKPNFFKRLRNFFIFNPFRRQNWTWRRTLSQSFILLIILGGFFGTRAWFLANKIFKGGGGAVALQENIDPTLLRGEGDGRVNVLLLGRGGEGHDGADLTDTIVIASINPIQKEAALLSIPRDLYVPTNYGGHTKINAVFAYAKENSLANSSYSDKDRIDRAEDAGFKAVEDILRSKIGIPIHYHGIIDFEGFSKAINTVGGVDAEVTESTAVYEPGMWMMGRRYDLNVKPGRNHFNGIRALAFTRSRYTSNRGDFDRAERQRLIMVALKEKILSAGTYSNPIKINQLMGDFGNHIRTNLGMDEVKRLYDIVNDIPNNKIDSVSLADDKNELVTTGMVDGQSVVYPKAGINNYREIQYYVRNRLKDGFLAHENATVAIFNGTEIVGLAGRTSDDLKSYGYNISAVADSPEKGVQKTILVDLRNGEKKYTKRYLENRFGVTTVHKLPSNQKIDVGEADFVIILGQNEQARLAN